MKIIYNIILYLIKYVLFYNKIMYKNIILYKIKFKAKFKMVIIYLIFNFSLNLLFKNVIIYNLIKLRFIKIFSKKIKSDNCIKILNNKVKFPQNLCIIKFIQIKIYNKI